MSLKKFFGKVRWDQVAPWKLYGLAALLAFVASASALLATTLLEWRGFWTDPGGLTVGVGLTMLAGVVTAMMSLRHFFRWRRRKYLDRQHPERSRLAVYQESFWMTCGAVIGLLLIIAEGLWAGDRLDVVQLPVFHQKVELLNPLVCINGVPTLGYTAPLPERGLANVRVAEISSVEICPFGRYALKIEGMSVRGKTYGGKRVDFNPPLKPAFGEELEVTVLGRETEYYKQVNSPTYLIRRALPYSYDELAEQLTAEPHPGFRALDWGRMNRVGLVLQDRGNFFPDGTTDILYTTYGDEPLDSRTIQAISFRFCSKRQGDIVGHMHRVVRDTVVLDIPPEGGAVHVRSWSNRGVILMSCFVK